MQTIQHNIVISPGDLNGDRPLALGNALAQAIREIALDRTLDGSFDKPRRIADLVETELKHNGSFCGTRDGRYFYVPHPERRLLDIRQEAFLMLLRGRTGLAARDRFFRFVLDHLRAQAARLNPVEVHALSFFDPKARVQFVSDGGGGVWRRELRGEWTRALNGTEGVYFITDPNADTWEPEFSPGDHLTDNFYVFLNQLPLTSSGTRFARDDQIAMLSMYLEKLLFPALRQTRIVPVFLGNNGIMPLRLIGRLLVGPRFEVSDLRTNKLGVLLPMLLSRTVVALENVTLDRPWLKDAVWTYASGARFEVRQHDPANELVSCEPQAVLLLASRDLPLIGADIAERVLPFYCDRLMQCEPDSVLLNEVDSRRGVIMGDLLRRIARSADESADEVPFRSSGPGWFVFWPSGMPADSPKSNEGPSLQNKLRQAQGDFAAEGDDVLAAVSHFYYKNNHEIAPILSGDLYRQCSEIACEHGWVLPKNSQAFGQRLKNLRPVIERELKARFVATPVHANKKSITIMFVGDRPKRKPSTDSSGGGT